MTGIGLGLGISKQRASTSSLALLSSYPAQSSGLTAVTDDFELNNASSEWTLAGDWSDNGDGTFTNAGQTAFSDASISFTFDANKEYAAVIEVSELDNDSQGIDVKTRPSNSSSTPSLFSRGVAVHAFNQPFVSTDTSIDFEAGRFWEGTVRAMGLFDVTDIDDMPVHIVIAAGQSNIVGFGTEGMDLDKDQWHPRIWNLPGSRYQQWSADDTTLDIANDPLQHQGIVNNQVGCAMAAARRIVDAFPNHRVVILPVGRTGTGLIATDAAWNPNTTGSLDLFTFTKDRYNALLTALGSVTVASTSLMWSQGEADGADSGYPAAFAALRSQWMTDLSLTELPTVILGRTIEDPANPDGLVAIQQKLDQDSGDAEAINDVVYFDLAGSEWVNVGDAIHFNAEGQRIRGDYAGQLLAHRLANSVGDWPGARVQN